MDYLMRVWQRAALFYAQYLTPNEVTMNDPNSPEERAKLPTYSKGPDGEDRWSNEDQKAPHEPAAILRAFESGIVGPGLAYAVGMRPKQSVDALRIAIEERDTARLQGREIHTDPNVSVVMCKPGEVKEGDKLFDCGREVRYAGSPYQNNVVVYLLDGQQVTFLQHHKIMVLRKRPA